MKGKGKEAKFYNHTGGEIYLCYTNKVFIEQRKSPDVEKNKNFDMRFFTFEKGNNDLKDFDSGLVIAYNKKAFDYAI